MSLDPKAPPPSENFFLNLAKHLTDLESKTSGVRQVVEVGVASVFLAAVLGRDWFDLKAKPQAIYDEWMQNRLKLEGINWIIYFHRLVRLADSLFTLVNDGVTGFDILRKRFQERPTKSCYIEAEIASLLTFNGFRVQIIGESGMRGRDFDFTANRDEISLSVEVTGKEGKPLTVSTIRNTLTKKRTQIPPNRPAVVYMHLPGIWMRDRAKAQAIFTKAFNEVFRKSHRFNGVFLVWEDVVPMESGGNSETYLWPCYNNHPRHSFDKWDLLNLRTDSKGRPSFAVSLYDFLKGVQAKHLAAG
jgi:hypothetical protein